MLSDFAGATKDSNCVCCEELSAPLDRGARCGSLRWLVALPRCVKRDTVRRFFREKSGHYCCIANCEDYTNEINDLRESSRLFHVQPVRMIRNLSE